MLPDIGLICTRALKVGIAMRAGHLPGAAFFMAEF
jgi:hypothetical protein